MLILAAMLALAALMLPPPQLRAQGAVDPSGHWEGTIEAPNQAVGIHIDLARDTRGAWLGTFGQAAAGHKGLPLTSIGVEGRSVKFKVKGGLPGMRTFAGTVSDDGQSISGDFSQRVYSEPPVRFSLTRKGNASIEAPPRNAAISQQLEGTWNGTLDANGRQRRLILRLSNQPDGSTGSIASVTEQLDFPIGAITHTTSSVTFGLPGVGASYSGTLNAPGTELTGAWTQGGGAPTPLTFRRASTALASLQGIWVVASMNGQSTGDREVVLAITEDAWSSIINGRVQERGSLKIDPASKPMTFDLIITAGGDKGKTQLGVVEVTGDTMKSKLNTAGATPRPSDFDVQDGYYVFVARKQ